MFVHYSGFNIIDMEKKALILKDPDPLNIGIVLVKHEILDYMVLLYSKSNSRNIFI